MTLSANTLCTDYIALTNDHQTKPKKKKFLFIFLSTTFFVVFIEEYTLTGQIGLIIEGKVFLFN